MNASHKCPQCGTIVEIESCRSEARAAVNSLVVMPAIFAASGWVFMNYGHPYWGGASLIAAVIVPLLMDILTESQRLLPIRAREAEKRQTEKMLEIVRREDAQTPAP